MGSAYGSIQSCNDLRSIGPPCTYKHIEDLGEVQSVCTLSEHFLGVDIISPLRTVVAGVGEVVVDNVHDDGDATLMARTHEVFQLIGAAGTGLQTKEKRSSVAPLHVAV